MAEGKPLFDVSSKDQSAEDQERKIGDILRPHKVIRDAIHGDIRITRLLTITFC